MWRYEEPQRSDELYHYGVLGMKWGQHKIRVAEKKIGRKLRPSDGFSKDGLDITNKGIKNIIEWDKQEARYKAAKNKKDPSYSYLRDIHLDKPTYLTAKEVNKIIKKMERKKVDDVKKEYDNAINRKISVKKTKAILDIVGGIAISSLSVGIPYLLTKK